MNRHLFINQVRGIIHVGANAGGEASTYDIHDLRVAWIEPIPEVFQELQQNIAPFPKQKAYHYLIGEKDESEVVLHISTNAGLSSSVLPLAKHRQAWPDVSYSRDITMPSTTLPMFVQKEGLDLSQFQALLIDTQGTELRILRGASNILSHFKFIQVEVPDFEAYAGCCLVQEMNDFMSAHGFRQHRCDRLAYQVKTDVGNYYDITYARSSA
jgi:FkbM family methyltransferase